MKFSEILGIELGPDQGVMCTMNSTGDFRVTWTRGNADEVELAREAFDEARKAGKMAYRVEGDHRGTVLDKFDPNAERIIIAPPMQGGGDAVG